MTGLQRIRELIGYMPGKDRELCMRFLEGRQFESILEIVRSDIRKAAYTDQEKGLMWELGFAIEDYVSDISVFDPMLDDTD